MRQTGKKEIIEADLVFLAMGFLHPEQEGLIKELRLATDNRDNIAVDNDTAMLKAAGTSVAMGNAIHGIQAFCDFTTTDIHEDGLANAFKTLGLV